MEAPGDSGSRTWGGKFRKITSLDKCADLKDIDCPELIKSQSDLQVNILIQYHQHHNSIITMTTNMSINHPPPLVVWRRHRPSGFQHEEAHYR